eukprot:5630112-Alexandrium_andersonii.AAC.1
MPALPPPGRWRLWPPIPVRSLGRWAGGGHVRFHQRHCPGHVAVAPHGPGRVAHPVPGAHCALAQLAVPERCCRSLGS